MIARLNGRLVQLAQSPAHVGRPESLHVVVHRFAWGIKPSWPLYKVIVVQSQGWCVGKCEIFEGCERHDPNPRKGV